VLTPLAIDPAHPFPFIPNLGFSLVLKLRRIGRRQAPLRPGAGARAGGAVLGAAAQGAAAAARPSGYISLESLVVLFLDHLFPGCEVEGRASSG
jgi:polyphosphate kinase